MSRISTAEYIAVEPGKAENIVIKLSKLFRYTLTTSERNMVPLSEELDMVSTYLSIEKERFGKRLEYGITTKGDPSNVGIPGLLIQTIVENCIKHGISPLPEGGRITIVCTISEYRVSIYVQDTGTGFGNTSSTKGTGHGINNFKERLQLMFGEKGSKLVGYSSARIFKESSIKPGLRAQ